MASTLSSRLIDKVQKYDNVDRLWVQYIKDHRYYLLTSSTKQSIPLSEMHNYRFRPREFVESKGYSGEMTWIILWLNQIPSSEDFVGYSELIFPDQSVINQLRAECNNFNALSTVTYSKLIE